MARVPSSAFHGLDLRRFGGVPVVPMGADVNEVLRDDPDAVQWNFGVMGRVGLSGPVVESGAPNFYDVAPPKAVGRWDGKTTVNPHAAARKVLGKDMPAQMQPRGTCGGRTGKMAGQLLQCVLIAAGKQAAAYKPVSHAWLYALARKDYGMLGSGDGVPDGSIPIVMAKYGLLHAEEAGDTKDYGAGSDNLAVKWGGRGGPPQEMFAVAADNKVENTLVKVRSVQEYADAAFAGGIGLVSSMRGFTMERDAEGVCAPRGTWAHYMTTSGIYALRNRTIIPVVQSWGNDTPSGPLLGGQDGWPDYVFGADAAVVERDMMLRGSLHMIFSYPLWDTKQLIDWRRVA